MGLKACRMRKRVYNRTQPAVDEDEAPVNAPNTGQTIKNRPADS